MNETHLSANQQTISPARQQAQLKHLEGIADKIREENLKVESYMRHTVKHALLAGKLLSEVKRMVGHGNWLEWFHAQQFSFGETTAQRYMRLFRRWPEIQSRIEEAGNPSTLTALTFNDALDILATPDPAESHTKPRKPIRRQAKSKKKQITERGSPPVQNLLGQSSQAVALPMQFERATDWLTPKPIIEAASRTLGKIDLDPAADHFENVPAAQRYTPTEDGLNSKNVWHGNVFLNPPCEPALLEQFVDRLSAEFDGGSVAEAILLLPSQTNAEWYRRFRNFARVFIAKLEETSGLPIDRGITAIYLGKRQVEFFDVFQELGDGYVPYRLCLEATK